MAKTTIVGMRELEKTIKKLGELPQKCVTKAARKGAAIAQKGAKRGGWVDKTGNLRKGLVLKGEKSRVKGKKVYQVTMNKDMNDTFVKVSKAGNRAYYPASQEYGFRTRDGGWTPGFHFMRDGLEENAVKVQTEIVSTLSKEIDKLK